MGRSALTAFIQGKGCAELPTVQQALPAARGRHKDSKRQGCLHPEVRECKDNAVLPLPHPPIVLVLYSSTGGVLLFFRRLH